MSLERIEMELHFRGIDLITGALIGCILAVCAYVCW